MRQLPEKALDAELRHWRVLDALHLALAILALACIHFVLYRQILVFDLFVDLPRSRAAARAASLVVLPYYLLTVVPYVLSWRIARQQYESSDRGIGRYIPPFVLVSLTASAALVYVQWSGFDIYREYWVLLLQSGAYLVSANLALRERPFARR